MVVFMDVDRFMTKKDFQALKTLRWPWNETHFLLSHKCHGCGHRVSKSSGKRPIHFVMNEEHIRSLLKEDKFWCENCKLFALYDHFTCDECELVKEAMAPNLPMKSKSSNTAITSKAPKPPEKKTRSNGQFNNQTPSSKKRGVYVEKKSKVIMSDGNTKNGKPPTRKDHKRFVAAVLKMISKCSTSAEYNEILTKIETENSHPKQIKKMLDQYEREDEEEKNKAYNTLTTQVNDGSEIKMKKEKFKSRILSRGVRDENESLVVLKKTNKKFCSDYSEKSFITTSNSMRSYYTSNSRVPKQKQLEITEYQELDEDNPIPKFDLQKPPVQMPTQKSNVSKPSSPKTLQKPEVQKPVQKPAQNNNVLKSVQKPVQKQAKKEIELLGEEEVAEVTPEPETMVNQPAEENEKQLYSLFVDLLETTIDVYNKTKPEELADKNTPEVRYAAQTAGSQDKIPIESHNARASQTASINNLSMDEYVTKKIGIPKEEQETFLKPDQFRDLIEDVEDNVYYYNFDNDDSQFIRIQESRSKEIESKWSGKIAPSRSRNYEPSRTKSPPSRSVRWRRSPTSSPDRTWEWMQPWPRTRSNMGSQRSQSFTFSGMSSKKKFKKNFLKMLEEELQMDDFIYEEPNNMYDALRIMALNKRKCSQAVSFDKNHLHTGDDKPDSECWKRRGVISTQGKIKRKPTQEHKKFKTRMIRSDRYKLPENTSSFRTTRSSEFSSTESPNTSSDSDISLKVLEYFEPDPVKRNRTDRKKEIFYATTNSANLSRYNSRISTNFAYRMTDSDFESLSKIVIGLNKGIC